MLRFELETVKPRAAGLLTDVKYSRVRNSTWIHLTSLVTNRTAVGLVDVHGNYPTSLEYDSNSIWLGLSI